MPGAEGAGGREPQAEEAAGGDGAGCSDAEGDARKKLLTPRVRRRGCDLGDPGEGLYAAAGLPVGGAAAEDLPLCHQAA